MDDETVLVVKHEQDGVLMKEFLSNSEYNISVNNNSISQIMEKKLNYKNELLEKGLPNQFKSVHYLPSANQINIKSFRLSLFC